MEEERKREPAGATAEDILAFLEPSVDEILAFLGIRALGACSVASKALRDRADPQFRLRGVDDFAGWGIAGHGTFGTFVGKKTWKADYLDFQQQITGFRFPETISGFLTCKTEKRDTCFHLNGELLSTNATQTIYVELEVFDNFRDVTLALANFGDGGKDCITFNPQCGAVTRETKIAEHVDQSAMRGVFVRPLPKLSAGAHRNFPPVRASGMVGVAVVLGKLAFFRRCGIHPNDSWRRSTLGMYYDWETTGFVIGLDWAEGRRLVPTVAFRRPGTYTVRARWSRSPPLWSDPVIFPAFEGEYNWRNLDEAEPEWSRRLPFQVPPVLQVSPK